MFLKFSFFLKKKKMFSWKSLLGIIKVRELYAEKLDIPKILIGYQDKMADIIIFTNLH